MDFKKLALSAAIISLTSTVYAGGFTPAPETPAPAAVPVTIPMQQEAWHVGVDLFWVEPTNDDLEFARISIVSGTTTTQNIHAIEPDFEFGFKVEGGYHFEGSGNDVTLNWTRMHSAESKTVSDVNNNVLAPLANNTVRDNAIGDAEFDFDAVNLEFGQHLDIGDRLDVRMHGGLQYAKVDSTLFVKTVDDVNINTHDTGHTASEWHGLGPRFGSDISFELGRNISAVAHSSATILVGEIKSVYTHIDTNAGVVNSTLVAHSDNERVIIPAADAKLGFAYNHKFSSDSTLTVEAGWQFAVYKNVVRHEVNNFVDGFSDPKSNFGMHGPYTTIKYRT